MIGKDSNLDILARQVEIGPEISFLLDQKCPTEDCNGWLEYQREIRGYSKYKCCFCDAVEIRE